ncbi:MaoC family dehydratase [Desulfospira joergensenii]|uniref:MaoC family dehydratase n=1 Tax=Desulfospira joergensenii TaxID=53329 RepID=UPI0003B40821|nr:MaoC/PaaZ C-terminal domain-containing protein [Desulfospira joergensenii]
MGLLHLEMKPLKDPYSLNSPDLPDPGKKVFLKRQPHMGFIFIKALAKGMFRPRTLADPGQVEKTGIILKGQVPSKERIRRYRTVCGFASCGESGEAEEILPAPFLQTLFVGLLGRYITSKFFPLTPLGLIHTHQSMEQFRPVLLGEVLDLCCSLREMEQTPKGIKTQFLLQVRSREDLVWKGISEFLTRSGEKTGTKKERKEEVPLKIREIIPVPRDTGRRYASVSGDYNPHHLYGITARLFGFSSPIAHGMWSLARVTAELEKTFHPGGAFRIEAAFKRPVFLPARISLGHECGPARGETEESPGTGTNASGIPLENSNDPGSHVDFELRDADRGLPHLKGRLILPVGPV